MTPSLACTGSSARWCPVCGDCACGPRYGGDGADGERTLDDDGCPLHGASSAHARDAAPDLAADHLALADALATAERELASLRERDAFLTRERIAVATALDVPYATPLGEAVATRLARLTAERDADAEKVASLRQERDARDAALYSERGARAEAEARLADLAWSIEKEREALEEFDDAESEVREADASPVASLRTRLELRARRDAALTAHVETRRATSALLAGAAAPRTSAGQFIANALHWLDATFYENARNTEIDPWERDDNVKEYLDHWRDALVVPWVKAAADARAEADALRATVEGRTVAPTDAEIEAHAAAGGRWRSALMHLRGGHDWMDDDDVRAKVRLSAPGTWRWWALDATGRPCPWPTVAAEAATGAALAGEGR